MYALILFLPLIGSLFAGFFGKSLGARASEIVTCTLVSLAALLSWLAFFNVGFGSEPVRTIHLLQWVRSGGFEINWALRIDMLTCVMLVVVTSVSALVHIYSIGYMHHDPHRPRFFAYLSLFTFSMLALVTADNLLQMFFGWEGVGLCSYLLIGFWYQRPSANAAAIKAFVVNRVGDFGFALGIFSLFVVFQTIDLGTIFSRIDTLYQANDPNMLEFFGYWLDGQTAVTIICLLLFAGAMGKSAQFLLHTWLPDAMEGPTPVSALIHAATMVTAGVFMVARLSPLFEYSQTALTIVTFIGATTAIFAASVGLVQNDIKRVIAYSTCSQLGYMFVALGVGGYSIAIFHLFTHAFFKALLFLGAGSVIHGLSDEQDMRRMGGLRKEIPATYWLMVIGTLALTGFPLTAGYFSKDAIIEAAYIGENGAAIYAFWMVVVAAAFTSFYSWRLIFMTFHGKARASLDVMSHLHESPMVMLIPLAALAAGALLSGFLAYDLFIGSSYASFWKASLYTSAANNIVEAIHHVPLYVKYAPVAMMIIGFVLAYYFYLRAPAKLSALRQRHDALYRFLLNKWYFDEIYDFLLVRPTFRIAHFLWRIGDGKIIDGFGPDGVAARVRALSARVSRLQSGYIYHYAFAMLIGVAVLISWSMFSGAGVG